jgi:hypothetical protein
VSKKETAWLVDPGGVSTQLVQNPQHLVHRQYSIFVYMSSIRAYQQQFSIWDWNVDYRLARLRQTVAHTAPSKLISHMLMQMAV